MQTQEITIEINLIRTALTTAVAVAVAAVIQMLPPWTDALLIPLATLLAAAAILHR